MNDQSLPDSSVSDERPQRLGSGSFASVYMIRGGNVAFKEAHRPNDAAILQEEYEILGRLYMSCNTDTFFMLPRPYAFCQPKNPASFRCIPPSSPLQKQKRRMRPEHPVVFYDSFEVFERPTYGMSRVFALPLEVARVVRKCFFPPTLQNATTTLCRLYFGKVFPQQSNRFFNSFNFPLDVARYEKLCSKFTPEQRDMMRLPNTSEIVIGMGEMLGRLHIRGGCDARDIEFVLGGGGGSDVSFFVIDFNQVYGPLITLCPYLPPNIRHACGTKPRRESQD